jgi:Dolichyl-phosphate-mannose-protein mannosyltransferase
MQLVQRRGDLAGASGLRQAIGWSRIAGHMRRIIGALALAGVGIGLFGDVTQWFVTPRTGRTLLAVDENFDEGLLLHPDWVVVTGFVPCLNGWCLAPGTRGTLRYRPRVSIDHVRDVQAYLWMYASAGVTNQLSISADAGQTWQVLGTNLQVVGKQIALGQHLRLPDGPFLRFEASNSGTTTVLVLDKLMLAYLDSPPDRVPSATRFLVAFLCFGAAGALLSRHARVAGASLLVVAVGALLRYQLLVETTARPLDPDSQGYRAYAAQMSWFGDTGFFSARFGEREPLFIFVSHLFFKLVGDSDFHLRLVSFGLSLVAIWLVIRIARTLFGEPLGWFTGAMMALNPALARESVRGLRLELETIVFLAVLAVAFVWRRPRGLANSLLLGALGGLMALTRTTYVGTTAAIQALAAYKKRRARRGWLLSAAISIGIMLVLLAPHRYNMYRLHADPFWDTARYARWNANFEFAGRPGFPTRQQLELNGYVGPPITYAQYMFGLHSVADIVVGTVRGYLKLFVQMTVAALRYDSVARVGKVPGLILLILAAGGFALASMDAAYRWLAFAFIVVEFPVAFLYDRGLVDQRHCLSSFPLVLLASALSLSKIVARLSDGPPRSAPDERPDREPGEAIVEV